MLYLILFYAVFNLVLCCMYFFLCSMYFCSMSRRLSTCYKVETVRIVKWWPSPWLRERGTNCWKHCVTDTPTGKIAGPRIARSCTQYCRKVGNNTENPRHQLAVLLLRVGYRVIADTDYFTFHWFINRHGSVLWEPESRPTGEPEQSLGGWHQWSRPSRPPTEAGGGVPGCHRGHCSQGMSMSFTWRMNGDFMVHIRQNWCLIKHSHCKLLGLSTWYKCETNSYGDNYLKHFSINVRQILWVNLF